MPSSTRFSCARILVVDDSVFERQLISMALQKAGFQRIISADDGADALKKTKEFQPDLVLLDLQMPTLDGFGYCELVRKDPTLPRMPIIVQTALEDRQSRLRALSCGADDFLTKPLDMAELTLRIGVHVDRYFMLREMENMCDYLKMELETVHHVRSAMDDANVASMSRTKLERHYEVLEQLAFLSAG